ncbi:MAG: thioredoxin family protein [Pseudazoarcus pumilus]|nr:thioredoxin family protein [Pseudazoarcus pumilus]
MSDTSDALVMCLCAEWCGVCRDYRDGFEALSGGHPAARFHWVDIEDQPEWPEALDIESFPTVLIQRGDVVLYLGPTLPQHTHLSRMLDTLLAMDAEEARRYAASSEERRAWQIAADFRRTLG